MYNASDSIITGNPACTICNATPAQCFNTTQRMWPDHCEFDGDSDLELDIPSELVQKGSNKFVDAYSAFADNTNNLQTPLDDILQGKGIETLFIAGIATDVVVDYTVRDAVTRGYKVVVVGDATAGISPQTEAAALEAFAGLDGVQVVNTTDVMDF
ncbi:pncA [Symbiodinium sp. CCMP2456]|nr:pncA [Symbiodinium sp. CCMP2456]